MYTILLVDDEIASLKGLIDGVVWRNIDISRVITAQSAAQARQAFAAEKIDFMLCDIEMPRENGLELMGWVKEEYRDTAFLFYTSHDKFAYVQEALRLGAFDYLLKPFPYPKLEQVLQQAVEKKKSRERISEYANYGEKWLENKGQLEEKFLRALMRNEIPGGREGIESALEKLQPGFGANSVIIPILCRLIAPGDVLDGWNWADFIYAVRNIATELIAPDDGSVVVFMEGTSDLLAFVLPGDNGQAASVYTSVSLLAESLHLHLKINVRGIVGSSLTPAECAGIYFKLQSAAENMVKERGVSLLEQGIESVDKAPPQYHFETESWKLFFAEGHYMRLQEAVFEEITARAAKKDINKTYFQMLYHAFLQVIYSGLEEKNISSEVLYRDGKMREKSFQALLSTQNLKDFIAEIIASSAKAVADAENSGTVIDRVKKYVNDNLGQDIDRDSIAANVYLNPAYLSRLFKKETGMLLSDYITRRRVSGAKKLLAETDLPISTIAIHLGYTNMPYFSRVFKKATGLPPGDYRAQNKS